ncbi:MAG: hypothetical protein M3N29_09195 [Chloroflexota bacterium]|nr:hypothetical protein [Chloroflexota bacterium]
MTAAIRALEPSDLDDVARLYESIYRRGAGTHDARFLRDVFLDGPAVDPAIPSLVYVGRDGRISGFIGATVTPMRFRGEPVRMVTASHLLTDPEEPSSAQGGLLLRSLLAGAQDLTITDTAIRPVAHMWRLLGGTTSQLASVVWLKIVHPSRFAFQQLARHTRRPSRWAAGSVLRTPGAGSTEREARVGSVRASPGEVQTVPLDAQLAIDERQRVLRGLDLVPDYSLAHFDWLLARAAAAPGGGRLVAKAVVVEERVVGWYVYRHRSDHVSSVLQLVGDFRSLRVVASALLRDARLRRASAVQGRLEPHLVEEFAGRTAFLRLGPRFLVHSRRPEIVTAVLGGRAMVSRLDGEWW